MDAFIDEDRKRISIYIYELAMSFPIIKRGEWYLPGVGPEDFDSERLSNWLKKNGGGLPKSVYHVCRFLLFVWDPDRYGKNFDLGAAASNWDPEQKVAFVKWFLNGHFV